MTANLKKLLLDFQQGQVSKPELISTLGLTGGAKESLVRETIEKAIKAQNAEELEYGVILLEALEEKDELIDLVHSLLLEPWHYLYEELAHDLQRRKNPASIPFLKAAMSRKYPYLESYGTGTRQFINQCGHALLSIGTTEAINAIRQLSCSADPVLKEEMLYRISRIEGRNDFHRTFDD